MNNHITISDVFRVMRERRAWLLAGTLFAVSLAAIASFALTRVYRAEALLAPVSTSELDGVGSMLGSLGGLAAMAGLALPSDNQKDDAIALLRSRGLTQAFIRENNLLPVLFHSKWDAEAATWKVDGDDVPTLWDGYKYFDRKVRKVYHDKLTGHVTVQIEWRDPELAARWANELAERVNSAMRKRAVDEASRSITQLQAEYAKTQIVGLQHAIGQLLQSQIERRTMAEVRDEFAFRVLDKALPPDEDDYVRPKPVLYIVVALFMGFVVSLAVLVLVERTRVLLRGSDSLDREAEGSRRSASLERVASK
nr:Wzz/FepE/Etk N-terminal domain-containing protein [uncultured Steroidobacter sp.]